MNPVPPEVDEQTRLPAMLIIEALGVLRDGCLARKVDPDVAGRLCDLLRRAGEVLAANVTAQCAAAGEVAAGLARERELRAGMLAKERAARAAALVQPN